MILLFGDILKNLRFKNKVSQKKLGEYLGVTKATISNWENHKGQAVGDQLIMIAKYFGVTVDYLLGFKDEEIDKVNALKKALNDVGVSDTEKVMQLIAIFKDKE